MGSGRRIHLRLEDAYNFVHDRVQEAAYSLIPQELRAEAHLRIGMLLAAHTPPDNLRKGSSRSSTSSTVALALITSLEEREQLAELNLMAGKRAKASTAYASALTYLLAGRGLLTEDLGASTTTLSSRSNICWPSASY